MNDGRRIVSGSKDQSLKIWDLVTLQCCVTLKGHTDLIWRVAVASDDSFAVSASKDDMLKVSPLFAYFLVYYAPTSSFQSQLLICRNAGTPLHWHGCAET